MLPHPVHAVALRARHPCHSYNNVLWPLIGRYVKEGLVMAPHHTNDLAPLLRYESSKLEDGALTSIAECGARTAAHAHRRFASYTTPRLAGMSRA
jgi:hypothetical protein